ncbi:hypothetical protein FQN54_006750 [Arachnomyces sp. PD_36]|nr:hypothetical protein FQN54_006750 [Arachnomyces sp. PD_36]
MFPSLSAQFLVFPLLQAFAAAKPTSGFSWNSTTALLAFGDSYTYVEGTHGRVNGSFIGSEIDFAYTPEELEGNKILVNHTSAEGANWVEFLTGCYEGSPADCTGGGQRPLWDFAFGGADVSAEHLPLHHNDTLDLDRQVEQYITYAHPVLELDTGNTLVAIWIGINDVNDSQDLDVSFPDFYRLIISTLFESISDLHDLGFRNFMFLSISPLDRTPSSLEAIADGEEPSPSTEQLKLWNSVLKEAGEEFGESHPKTTVLSFDAYGALNDIIDHAEEYGIENVSEFCEAYDAPDIDTNYEEYGCLPLSKYFWYNSGHIGSTAHQALAGKITQFLGGV